MTFSDKEWEAIVHSVAEMGDTFTEDDALKLGEWIKKALIDEAIARMVLNGDIFAKVRCDGELMCKKTPKLVETKKREADAKLMSSPEFKKDMEEFDAKLEKGDRGCN
jgi:hypothetical protein